MLANLFNRNSNEKRQALLYQIGIYTNLIDMFKQENIFGFDITKKGNRTATLCYNEYRFTLIVKQIYVEVEVERNGMREKVVTYAVAEDVAKEWHHKDRQIRTLAKKFFEHFLLLSYDHFNYNAHHIAIADRLKINKKLDYWKALKRKYDSISL